jgi:hypothetical protein
MMANNKMGPGQCLFGERKQDSLFYCRIFHRSLFKEVHFQNKKINQVKLLKKDFII